MLMFDGIFFISSALCVDKLSVFDNETRLKQTIDTFRSIDRVCPNNVKMLFDCSPLKVPPEYYQPLSGENDWIIQMGDLREVKYFSELGARSLAETFAFRAALEFLDTLEIKAKRIYKISGRYTITDAFVLDDPSYKDAFVFRESTPTWMSIKQQEITGVDRVYDLRLWHMDYSLLPTFQEELNNIYDDCLGLGLDVEHSYYKHLNKYKVVEVPKIGVTGTIAPTGEVVDE